MSTGVFGSYLYPTRESYHQIRRSVAMHSTEVTLQAVEILPISLSLSFLQRNEYPTPTARCLTWLGDDEVKLDITESEKKLINEFRDRLENHHNYLNVPRSELLRYIIGCKHRLQVAERRFLNLKDLERTFNLNDVTLGQVRDELKKPCYILAGKDKLGRAIIAFKIRHFKPKKADVSVMMKSVLTLADAMLSDIDTLRNGAIIVFDMKGLSRENFSFQLEKV